MLSCLILCSVLFSTCSKPKPVLQPVLVGDTRIVAKVVAGAVAWQPGENQAGTYYLVTPALIERLFTLALENSELKAEIKKLEAQK